MKEELAMSFLSVTQQASVSVYPFIGKGNKLLADDKATEAMRESLNEVHAKIKVVIGEGEMDEAPMLYIGEQLGKSDQPELDLAVDPIDGTTLVAKGQGNAIAVLAAAPKGSLLHAPDMYMHKIAVGPMAAGNIDIGSSIEVNLKNVAEALNKPVSSLNVMIQDRQRHESSINAVQKLGASVILFSDVDITGVIATALDEHKGDLLIGTGGAPEGVIAATAIRSLGGDFQGQLVPGSDDVYKRCIEMGIEKPDKLLTLNDIVSSDECFFVASGITDGPLLEGVKDKKNGNLQTQTFISMNQRYHYIDSVHPVVQNKELIIEK